MNAVPAQRAGSLLDPRGGGHSRSNCRFAITVIKTLAVFAVFVVIAAFALTGLI